MRLHHQHNVFDHNGLRQPPYPRQPHAWEITYSSKTPALFPGGSDRIEINSRIIAA
jgi:hypothetical protein